MKKTMQSRKILLVLFFLSVVGFVFYTPYDIKELTLESKNLPSSSLKSLSTKGNTIIQDGKPIILKGAVSDYFRYNYITNINQEGEFKNLTTLEKAGANLIGLYLSDYPQIKENIEQLDKYIEYANNNGMYIYLAPVGHNFYETQTLENKYNYWINPNDKTDLTQLTEFLSERYKDKPGVLYQLAAEVDISPKNWSKKQKELINIIRKHTKNPIIVNTSHYAFQYESLPFSEDVNLIYQTGGYVRHDDGGNNFMPVSEIVDKKNNLSQKYPVLVGEFGGNSQKDFSSSKDLEALQEILDEIKNKNVNFTAYRIGPNFKNDPMSLFDMQGILTKKGALVLKYLGN